MNIAYLVNQYPFISHSFIRREIQALEHLGINILRISIRSTISQLIDETDKNEFSKTSVILETPVIRWTICILRILLAHPFRFCKAVSHAVKLGFKSQRGIIRHFIYLAEACILKRILETSQINHLHAHFGTNPATVAFLCRILGGPPYSFSVHGPEEFDNPMGLSLKEKIIHADFVIAVCNYGKSQLMRQCHFRHWSKIHVVHCTVDASFLNSERMPVPDNHRMVCIGRLSEQKGHLILIDALKQLENLGIEFEMVFIGDGAMRGVIENHINELKLNGHIRVTGWMKSDDIIRLVRQSRAVVQPSFAEGLPVVIMEAFAVSRPVVSTFIAGIPELVENNVNGYLVPAGSSTALVYALRRILTDDVKTLQRMGQNGYTTVQTNYNSLKEAEKLKELFMGNLKTV